MNLYIHGNVDNASDFLTKPTKMNCVLNTVAPFGVLPMVPMENVPLVANGTIAGIICTNGITNGTIGINVSCNGTINNLSLPLVKP